MSETLLVFIIILFLFKLVFPLGSSAMQLITQISVSYRIVQWSLTLTQNFVNLYTHFQQSVITKKCMK